MLSPITVIGGTGRIGGLVIDRLQAAGAEVRVISRHARNGQALAARDVRVHLGDVREADTLVEPLSGVGGVMVSVEPGTSSRGPESPKATMFDGVRNVLAAATAGGLTPHIVLISQIYVTRPDNPMNQQGKLLDWRLAGENEVRSSGLPYTIVRPSWITNGHRDGRGVRLEQGDTSDGSVCAEDVADACYQGFVNPAAVNKTFEMYNEPGGEPNWDSLLGALAADAGLVTAGGR